MKTIFNPNELQMTCLLIHGIIIFMILIIFIIIIIGTIDIFIIIIIIFYFFFKEILHFIWLVHYYLFRQLNLIFNSILNKHTF